MDCHPTKTRHLLSFQCVFIKLQRLSSSSLLFFIIISIINESYIMTCTVSFAPAATGLTGTGDTTTVWNLITLQHTEGGGGGEWWWGGRWTFCHYNMYKLQLWLGQQSLALTFWYNSSFSLSSLAGAVKAKASHCAEFISSFLKRIWLKSRCEAIIFTLSRMLRVQQARNTRLLFSHCQCSAEIASQRQIQYRYMYAVIIQKQFNFF